MKKLIALLLALVMVFALCACGDGNAEITTQSEEAVKEPVQEDPSDTTSAQDEEDEPEQDLIAIESITLTPKRQDYTEMVVKIRNLTDEKQDYIGTDIQALDEKGDIICERPGVSIENVQPGQAGNTMTFGLNCGYEEIASLSIYEYYFGEKTEGNAGYTVREKIDFINPLIFVMNEEVQDGNHTSYVWETK